MFDSLTVFARQIQPLLVAGEDARFCALVAYFPGEEELGVSPGDGLDLVDVAMDLPSGRLLRLADRVVTGTTLLGWPGCQAEELSQVVLRGAQTQLLLTDRRLLVIDAEFTPLWQVPLPEVRRIRRRWRLAQAGRVMVQLSDGSAVALVLGAVSARNARRLVQAHGSAR